MKVALAHDFLIRWGGAEKVLFDLHKIFPEAPIYTLFYDRQFISDYFPNSVVKGSWLQKYYVFLGRFRLKSRRIKANAPRLLLPFMAIAAEEFDFSEYDLVVSSSAAFMKGIIVPSTAKHICYLHTPTRWAWQDYYHRTHNMEHRTSNSGGGAADIPLKRAVASEGSRRAENIKQGTFLKKIYCHFFRIWDFEAAQRPDVLIANSGYTKGRIKKYYKRQAEVVYPYAEFPISNFQFSNKSQIPNSKPKTNTRRKKQNDNIYSMLHAPCFMKYFIVVSRLSAYKRIDWAIEAFKDLPYNLVIVGEGPEKRKLEIRAEKLKIKEKIIFTGFVNNRDKFVQLIKNSLGLIHLAEEDFGLAMLEALKLGRPVIALNRGGSTELIKPAINGELVDVKANNTRELRKVIIKIAEKNRSYVADKIKESVKRFSRENFEKEVLKIING